MSVIKPVGEQDPPTNSGHTSPKNALVQPLGISQMRINRLDLTALLPGSGAANSAAIQTLRMIGASGQLFGAGNSGAMAGHMQMTKDITAQKKRETRKLQLMRGAMNIKIR